MMGWMQKNNGSMINWSEITDAGLNGIATLQNLTVLSFLAFLSESGPGRGKIV